MPERSHGIAGRRHLAPLRKLRGAANVRQVYATKGAQGNSKMNPLEASIEQRILDEQGYLVIRSPRQHKLSDVLMELRVGVSDMRRIQGPLVVVAETTREEWARPSAKTFDTHNVLVLFLTDKIKQSRPVQYDVQSKL